MMSRAKADYRRGPGDVSRKAYKDQGGQLSKLLSRFPTTVIFIVVLGWRGQFDSLEKLNQINGHGCQNYWCPTSVSSGLEMLAMLEAATVNRASG